jgi:hypothetical protein
LNIDFPFCDSTPVIASKYEYKWQCGAATALPQMAVAAYSGGITRADAVQLADTILSIQESFNYNDYLIIYNRGMSASAARSV